MSAIPLHRAAARAGAAPVAWRPPRPRVAPRRLAILHVITRLDRGGSADCTLLQAMGAARRGHRVTLASGPSGSPSPLLATARAERGIHFVEIPSLVRQPAPVQDMRALISLTRLVRRGGFDIVHTHTSKAGAIGRVAAFLGGRPPLVHQPHGHLFCRLARGAAPRSTCAAASAAPEISPWCAPGSICGRTAGPAPGAASAAGDGTCPPRTSWSERCAGSSR